MRNSIPNDPFSRYAARLQHARDLERARIARDLHDVLGGTLTALKLETRQTCKALEKCLAHKPDVDILRILNRVTGLDTLIDDAIASTRNLVTDYRSDLPRELGLAAALEHLADDFSRRTGLPCVVCTERTDHNLAETIAVALFRATQESLTNVIRHANAARVTIRLRQDPAGVGLSIEDDGVGFELNQHIAPQSAGVRNMRERLHALGGSCTIDSAPGHGTRITLRVGTAAPRLPDAQAASS